MINKYTKFADIPFSAEQWQLLKKAIDDDIDVCEFANENFSTDQLEVLIKGKSYQVDISVINDPMIPAEQMENILDHIMKEMGIYECEYEKVRRKWLINITWMTLLIILISTIAIIYLVNQDTISLYSQNLQLQVEDSVELEAGAPFNAMDYVIFCSDNGTLKLPQISTDKIGSYVLEYTLSNEVKEMKASLKLKIIDRQAPLIYLKQEFLSIEKNQNFSCRNYVDKVIDNVDGDITDKVTCNTIDFNKERQEITYTVADSSGNKAVKKMIVVVKQPIIYSENNVPDQKPATSSVPVTASEKVYPFQPGDTFESVMNQCAVDGQNAISAGKANKYECKPVTNSEGIASGYRLIFE
ncbi:MAG: DUF5011 domain-containing protein [Erysipelotrichaceae bacterium]|nr:DUF5011 domain-containing protein [Erysipelotrichaceae bacterium]